MNFRTILREPLVHFLVLGAALSLLYGLVSPGDGGEKAITIGQRTVDGIIAQYRAQWNRPPTATELRALVDTRISDEILYREGKAMGLDKDDPVIERRIRQKYELMAEEEGAVVPTVAELEAYRTAHPARFTPSPLVTFDQLFFDPATTDPVAMAKLRTALSRGAAPAGMAQPSLLPAHVAATPLDQVARDFGAAFSVSVGAAPVGKWIGPVASGYGVHLVRVRGRTVPSLPPLAQIRDAVEREWANDQRLRARSTRLAALRAGYDVTVTARQLPAR